MGAVGRRVEGRDAGAPGPALDEIDRARDRVPGSTAPVHREELTHARAHLGELVDAAAKQGPGELEPPRALDRRRRRAVGPLRVGGLEREQGREQPHARDAVEHRVVGLGDDREAARREALDEPQLPERALPIEPLREDASRERAQLGVRARPRNGGVPDVEVEPVVRVLRPHGPQQRDRVNVLLEARQRRDRAPDGCTDGRHVERPVGPHQSLAVEDRDRAHVHVERAGLDREEGAIE